MYSIKRALALQNEVQHPSLKVKDYSKEEEHELWLKAGDLGKQLRDKMALEVKPNASVLDLCNIADSFIRENEAKPAFPINIGINDVAAHYTGTPEDDLKIPKKGVVKIDVGVSLEGYISDTATSVDLDGSYSKLLEVNQKALDEAIQFMRPGADTGSIGGIIEKIVTDEGFYPIRELRGHSVERFAVHAGKTVPNVRVEKGDKVELGEVFAIEPFVSTHPGGLGQDYSKVNIFRVAPFKVPLRTKPAKKIQKLAIHEFQGLPFAERWLIEKGVTRPELKMGMMELRKVAGIQEYHVLRATDSKAVISQFEHTMIIEESGAKVTTI